MNKKVILIHPAGESVYLSEVDLPLSILYIAMPLTKEYEIKIIDQRISNNWEEDLKKAIEEGSVVCVGITSFTGPRLEGAIKAAKIVKELSAVPVVFGGIHTSLLKEQTLQNDFVDFIVFEEGEETFYELVKSLDQKKDVKNIKGLGYKIGSKIYINEPRKRIDLETMGLPHSLMDDKIEDCILHPSGREDERVLSIQTSRGCPHRCTFCYSILFDHRFWRGKSPQKTVGEIKYLVNKYNLTGIFLVDDNFFVDQERVKRICELIIQSNLKIDIYNTNCRADYISRFDVGFLSLLKKAGIRTMFIGAESGSDKILKRINKDITVEHLFIANRKLKEAGIFGVFAFMVGFPFENDKDIKQTLSIIQKLKKENKDSKFGISVFIPYPCLLMEECIKAGFDSPKTTFDWAKNWNKLTLPWISTKKMKLLKKMDISFALTTTYRKYKPLMNCGVSILNLIESLRLRFNFYHLFFEDSLLNLYKKLKKIHT